jgi:hypothetical protein
MEVARLIEEFPELVVYQGIIKINHGTLVRRDAGCIVLRFDVQQKHAELSGYGADDNLAQSVYLGANRCTSHVEERDAPDTEIRLPLPGSDWIVVADIGRYLLTIVAVKPWVP